MIVHNYVSAWKQIAARIKGLCEAGMIHAQFLQAHSGSPYGADKELNNQARSIRLEINAFKAAFSNRLPPSVTASFNRFEADGGNQIDGNSLGDALLTRTIIVKLAALESEVSYLLSDSEQRIVLASENAFKHLQRLIVVDPDYRKKWIAAFKEGEVECERHGAIHLQWHDVWAFKVHGEGGRTDLVYQETLRDIDAQDAPALILTEWKITKGSGEKEFEQARKQAEIYGDGVMGGVELASRRFLVVVSLKAISAAPDLTVGGVTYRHINIAVDPDRPSVAAKAKNL